MIVRFTIRVYNNTGAEIPAMSFAKLLNYQVAYQYFIVSKPDADGLAAHKVVIIPEAIPNGKVGYAYIGGVGVVKATTAGQISAGDLVGTDENQWTAIEGNQFYVLTVDDSGSDDLLVVRRLDAALRKAYCKNDAGTGSTIACYLDTDETGPEITVNCNISGGSNLNEAIRRLKDGNRLLVCQIDGTWYSAEGFQVIDATKGLEISGGKLAVKLDTDEMHFDDGGVSTNLLECS